MKNLLLTTVLFFLINGCYTYNTHILHRKYYSLGQSDLIKKEVYDQIKKYKADSIPLKDWLFIGESLKEENVARRVFTQIYEDKSELHFVLTTHENKDSTFYDFSIYTCVKEKK